MALPIHPPVRGRTPARTGRLCGRIGARRLPRRGVHLRLVGAPAGGSAPRLMLYVVRHGETAPNAAGLLLGLSDPRLTERGRTQAAGLAATLPAPDRVVSSPLRRARETAAAFGRTVEVDDRWIELDYGRLEGTDPASVPTEVWAQWPQTPTTRRVGVSRCRRSACGSGPPARS